jgi:hypothetical protein
MYKVESCRHFLVEIAQAATYILNSMQTIQDLSILVVKAAMERLLILVVLSPTTVVAGVAEPTFLASVQLCLPKVG